MVKKAMLKKIPYSMNLSNKFWKIITLFFLLLFVFSSTSGCKDLQSGIDAFKSKEYDKAIKILKDYLKDNPDDVNAHFFLGSAYFKKSELDLAQKEFEKVLEEKSKHTKALYQLGLVFYEKKEFKKAKKLFEKGLNLRNDKAWFYNGMGLVQMAEGDLENADVSFRSAIFENPDVAEFHKNLGDVSFKKDVLPIAIDEYRQAVELDSTLAEAHYKLGEAYFLSRDFNSAVGSFKSAVRLDPQYKDAYLRLGNLYMIDRKHYPQAKVMYEEYLKLDDTNPDVYLSLGKALYYIGDLENTILNLEKAKKLTPEREQIYHFLGMAYQDSKNFDKALKSYDDYVILKEKENSNPWEQKDAEFWMRKGRAHLALGDSSNLEKGSLALNKAVELDSTTTEAFCSLGYTLYRQEKYTDAIHFFNKCIEFTKGDVFNPLIYLAYSYIAQGDHLKSVSPLLKAIELQPENVEVKKTLAIVYYREKDYEKAVKLYPSILKKYPDDCEPIGQYSYSLVMLQKYKEAIPYLKKSIKCYPNDIGYMLLLAQAYELNKSLDDAYRWYMKVLKIDSNNQEAKKGRDRIDMQRF